MVVVGITRTKVKEFGILNSVKVLLVSKEKIQLLVLVSFCAAISVSPGSLAQDRENIGNQNDQTAVHEAVFLDLFEKADLPKDISVYCLSIIDKDPPNDFLRRFPMKTVQKASQCQFVSTDERGSGPGDPIIDKSSGKRAVIFSVRKISFESQARAKVVAGYEVGVMSGATIHYDLVRKSNKWIVKKRKIKSQS